jgi:hypothetical protein
LELERFDGLERSDRPAARQAGAIERYERLERQSGVEPGTLNLEPPKGLEPLNIELRAYARVTSDVKKYFSPVTPCVISVL